MKWVDLIKPKRLGTHYEGANFCVDVNYKFREVVSVVLVREIRSYEFYGEREGDKWDMIALELTPEVSREIEAEVLSQLRIGLTALGWKYEVYRKPFGGSAPIVIASSNK